MEDTIVDLEAESNLFSKVLFRVREARTRYIVVYGGAASGKSYGVHQLEIINIMQAGAGDTLFIRKHAADLRESCYKLLKTLVADWGVGEEFTTRYSNEQRKLTCIKSGRSIILRGIDDPEKLKSIAGIRRIVIEEASQLTFADFLELNRRARGMHDIQIIFILNPVSENHWIKTKFYDPGAPYYTDTTALKFTYHDNCRQTGEPFLTETDIKELERLKDINENQYRIYTLAQWGIDNTDGKFCWAFSSTQIKPTVFEPEIILWASFDFNVNPLTCTLAQILPEASTIRAIECLKLDNSDIWTMCDRLTASYPHVMWMVTGDATGNNSSALLGDDQNFYKIIKQKLGLTNQQMPVPLSNPRIEENRLLVNAVHKNWTVQIDPHRCQPLIYDLQYVEVNQLNQILKDRSAPNKFADFLDTWRYLINAGVKPWFEF